METIMHYYWLTIKHHRLLLMSAILLTGIVLMSIGSCGPEDTPVGNPWW